MTFCAPKMLCRAHDKHFALCHTGSRHGNPKRAAAANFQLCFIHRLPSKTGTPVEERFMSLSAQIAQFQRERLGGMSAELRNTLLADTSNIKMMLGRWVAMRFSLFMVRHLGRVGNSSVPVAPAACVARGTAVHRQSALLAPCKHTQLDMAQLWHGYNGALAQLRHATLVC